MNDNEGRNVISDVIKIETINALYETDYDNVLAEKAIPLLREYLKEDNFYNSKTKNRFHFGQRIEQMGRFAI